VRVVAGRWRGRRLRAPRGPEVRPTTDRVKEALFNILGPGVEGCLVLDLCCGAGGLGIEALSRGARHVRFVDAGRAALEALRGNLAACGAGPETYTVVRAEVRAWFAGWEPPAGGGRWLVLADPPYRTDLARAIMDRVDDLADRPGFAGAVVEFGSGPEGGPEPADPWEVRRYGESALAVRRPR